MNFPLSALHQDPWVHRLRRWELTAVGALVQFIDRHSRRTGRDHFLRIDIGAHRVGREFQGFSAAHRWPRGGIGIVFRARHLRLNRLVALKMLLGSAYAGPQDLARKRYCK